MVVSKIGRVTEDHDHQRTRHPRQQWLMSSKRDDKIANQPDQSDSSESVTTFQVRSVHAFGQDKRETSKRLFNCGLHYVYNAVVRKEDHGSGTYVSRSRTCVSLRLLDRPILHELAHPPSRRCSDNIMDRVFRRSRAGP